MEQALSGVLPKSWFIAWWRRTVAGRRAYSCAEVEKFSIVGPARLRNVLGVVDLEAFLSRVLDRGVAWIGSTPRAFRGFIVPDRGAVRSPGDVTLSPYGFFNS